MTIRLEQVIPGCAVHLCELYLHLSQRTPDQAISHKVLPTFEQHAAFVRSLPYAGWWLILAGDIVVGNIYLTHQREIGIHICAHARGNGYGEEAIAALKQMCPGKFLANINPKNERSISFFQKQGFGLLQQTYILEPST